MPGEITQPDLGEAKCKESQTSVTPSSDVTSDKDKEYCDVNFQPARTERTQNKRVNKTPESVFSEKPELERKQESINVEEHYDVNLRTPQKQTKLDLKVGNNRSSFHSERQNNLSSTACNAGCKQSLRSNEEVISKQRRSSIKTEDALNVERSLDDDGNPATMPEKAESESDSEVYIGPVDKRLEEDKAKKELSPLRTDSKRKAWTSPSTKFNVDGFFQNDISRKRKGWYSTRRHRRPFSKRSVWKRVSKLNNLDRQSIQEKDYNNLKLDSRLDYEVDFLKTTLENIKKQNTELLEKNYQLECENKELKNNRQFVGELREEVVSLKRIMEEKRQLPRPLPKHGYYEAGQRRPHHEMYMYSPRRTPVVHKGERGKCQYCPPPAMDPPGVHSSAYSFRPQPRTRPFPLPNDERIAMRDEVRPEVTPLYSRPPPSCEMRPVSEAMSSVQYYRSPPPSSIHEDAHCLNDYQFESVVPDSNDLQYGDYRGATPSSNNNHYQGYVERDTHKDQHESHYTLPPPPPLQPSPPPQRYSEPPNAWYPDE